MHGGDVRVYQDNLGYTQVVTVAGPVRSNEHNTQWQLNKWTSEWTAEKISITECRFDTSAQFMSVSKLPFWPRVWTIVV